MEFLSKYTPKHYKSYVSIIDNIIDNNNDIHRWIKKLSTKDIIIWLKIFTYIEEEDKTKFEECAILATLTIRFFIIEMDIDKVKLKNIDIKKILSRMKRSLEVELAYRKDVIKKTPKYTILRDVIS